MFVNCVGRNEQIARNSCLMLDQRATARVVDRIGMQPLKMVALHDKICERTAVIKRANLSHIRCDQTKSSTSSSIPVIVAKYQSIAHPKFSQWLSRRTVACFCSADDAPRFVLPGFCAAVASLDAWSRPGSEAIRLAVAMQEVTRTCFRLRTHRFRVACLSTTVKSGAAPYSIGPPA